MDVYSPPPPPQQQHLKNKRSSMLAYVPIHRRNEDDEKRTNGNNNKYRSSMSHDLQLESSVSSGSLSNNNNKRASLMGYRRSTSSNANSNNNNSNNRYSRNSFLGDDDADYSLDYDNHNEQSEDWENILRQYDRYSMNDDDKRKSKRASRIMDSYQDLPVEVPIVDEPTVVLDCYDFPPAFKTHHLHDIFRSYESSRGGYKIKWLSDTRALIIFDHPATAKKAYIDNVTHALAKIRPYDGPTDFLKDMNPPAQQQQRTMNRPMSMDFKRQSFNAYSSNNVPSAASRSSNRSSMRIDENDIKRLNIALD
ncbi:conserved hypothetical protein [Mucor ambiguus]|uniref:Thc1 RRM domain-containing protein n=1 Tax=Mucor ambiguus TaxID=91626 RepID=A0A0C9LYV7_9FUNG|nr:conserved hypothetical protein [Mucor ambiguus]